MRKRKTLALVAVIAEVYGALTYFGLKWGATREERKRSLPGDDVVADPLLQTDHAITIDSAPDRVWPWLVQMGWGRAGWYTYRWVDKLLFPANGPSATRILPDHQSIAVGDTIPDGPPEKNCSFTVNQVEPNEHLVLVSHSHLPPQVRSAWMDWSWTYALSPTPSGGTRLHVRSRMRMGPRWLAFLYVVGIGADFVMSRSQLRAIKGRVESMPPVFAAARAA